MQPELITDSNGKIPESPLEKPSISLNKPSVRDALANRIKQEIDDHCEEVYWEGYRKHLGASTIGDECKRRLWYRFRWCATDRPDGRLQRLFNRGHLEEKRQYEWLLGIGCQVWHINPETGKQYTIDKLVSGHFGGSLDGIVKLPARYEIDEPLLWSCKTSGTGSGFNKMREPGSMRLIKPQYYAQECIYGKAYDIKYALYLVANKNDDDLAVKVEELDMNLADQLADKAKYIIFAQDAPKRLSENPTHPECKNLCDFKEICHYKKEPARNCRSCVMCYPIDEGNFFCKKWDNQIPEEAIPVGCGEWISIDGPSAPVDVRQPGEFEIENVPLPK